MKTKVYRLSQADTLAQSFKLGCQWQPGPVMGIIAMLRLWLSSNKFFYFNFLEPGSTWRQLLSVFVDLANGGKPWTSR